MTHQGSIVKFDFCCLGGEPAIAGVGATIDLMAGKKAPRANPPTKAAVFIALRREIRSVIAGEEL